MKTVAFALPLILSATLSFAQAGQPGAHFIENWDMDGDGQVTLAEATEKRESVFYAFDADDNGSLDASEYVTFDQARAQDMQGQAGHGQGGQGKGQGQGQGQGQGAGAMKQAETGMHLAFNDKNSDGMVSMQEFLDTTPAWIEMMDRNADGVITTSDFGRG